MRWPQVLAAAGVLAAGFAVLFAFDPAQHAFYPRCLFYYTTGLLCPGCGALRAVHQLLHGHVARAMHFNALLVLSLPFWAYWGMRRLGKTTGLMPGLQTRNRPHRSLGWIWAGIVVVFAFWILRNLPFAHAAWLAP